MNTGLLQLPTKRTWGIAINANGYTTVARWRVKDDRLICDKGIPHYIWLVKNVIGFIPLTGEQIKQIEAAR